MRMCYQDHLIDYSDISCDDYKNTCLTNYILWVILTHVFLLTPRSDITRRSKEVLIVTTVSYLND